MIRNLKQPLFKRYVFMSGILLMLLMAFVQGYKTTHDLTWAFDTDFDRDISFIQGNLDGEFGKDPNYIGEYLWYNPLLFCVETVIVKVTGLPPNIVVTQAGIYLNALAPLTFVLMVFLLFDLEMAMASLLAFLFLATGDLLGWGAATYSPWLYPVCFVQFLFYLNVLFLYKAIKTQRFLWFILLGSFTGISFLGHVAPALIMVCMIGGIQGRNIYYSIRRKEKRKYLDYFRQTLVLAVTFLIAASPLLIVIAGHYRMHYVNRSPFEYTDPLFQLSYFRNMLKANLNLTTLISVIGFYWFYTKFQDWFVRTIISSWLLVSLVLYVYSSMLPMLHYRFHIYLPGTVPSFHYFFYLKALESVFFGFGLIALLQRPVSWISNRLHLVLPGKTQQMRSSLVLAVSIMLIAILYYPVYQTRKDFVFLREMTIQKEKDKEKLEVYQFIVNHVPSDKVILCEPDPAIYPVMATGRKMVSINATFSNPFLSFEQRENDRNNMLSYLINGFPDSTGLLFKKYQVSYILLTNTHAEKIKQRRQLPGELIFRNKSFILLSIAG